MAESLEIGKLTFEWVGGALKSEQPRQVLAAFRDGRAAALEACLAAGGVALPRTVQVINMFDRSTQYPVVSAVLPDEHGARCRLTPKYGRKAVAVVLCRPGEKPEELARKLDAGVKKHLGLAEPAMAPTEPLVVRRAAEMAGAVRASGFRGSLVEFAEAVAEEAGPGADPSYWWKALLAAELEGLVFRSSCGFVPADSEPGGPICPPEEETPVPASVTAPAPVKPAAVSPPPVTVPASRPADDDKVAQFLAAADTMTRAAAAIKEALRKRAAARDQLADARQTLAAAQAAVDRLEAELINLDAAVDAARAAVNLDALLAIA